MHRNTYILVSILAVLAALVVGVNFGKKINPQPAQPIPTPTIAGTPTPAPVLQAYVNAYCGFSLEYGSEFSLMDSGSGSAILNRTGDQSQSVVMACQKDIPRPALPEDKIESTYIRTTGGASVSAKLYHDQSAKDGTPVDALIFTHPTKKFDVFVAGFGESFNGIIKTIQVIP